MTVPASPTGFFVAFRQLIDAAIPFRRVQLLATLLLTLAAAVAELCTLGAVLPLLAIAARPEAMGTIRIVGPMLTLVSNRLEVGPVIVAAMLLTVAAVGATFVRLALLWASQKFVFGLQQDLALKIFARTLRQPYIHYLRQNSSVLISSQQKIAVVVGSILIPVMQAMSSLFMATAMTVFLFLLDPAAAFIAAGAISATYLLITLYARHKSRAMSQDLAAIHAARVQTIQETLGGIRDINLDQSQSVFEARLLAIEDKYRRMVGVANFISMAPRLLVEGVAIVLVAAMAAWFSLRPGGVMGALPVLGTLALGAQRTLPMVQTIYQGYVQYSLYAGNVADLVSLLHAPVENFQAVSPDEVKRFKNNIVLRKVGFNYGEGRDALSEINLDIPKGARIGFIGKTGSGKSTLVDVIMGLLVPTRGELLVDGVQIESISIGNWKGQIAHVPQVIFLTDDSIAANIAFGLDPIDVDHDRVRRAADDAGLSEFVDTLVLGLATTVGERGVRLSGGQRQRIGIARALYKRASVLVLDEATSALDDETEAAVMTSVSQLDKNLTVILIAHRLSTVASCDRVYRLRAGRIIAQGSFAEVTGGLGFATPDGNA